MLIKFYSHCIDRRVTVSADIEILWVVASGRVIFKKKFSSNEMVIWLCSLPGSAVFNVVFFCAFDPLSIY